MARPYLANRSVFAGTWATRGNSIYRGTALFHLVEKTDTLDGQWVGPHGNGEPNGGRWVLDRYDRSKTEYLTPVWRRILRALRAERGIPRSIIADIVQRHEDHAGRAEVVEGLKLSLNHGAVVPTLGKVSIPLIRYVLPLVAEGQTVLDLGTGSGFYAIYLAKHAHAHALGVDVSSSLIEQAMHNAAANGVEERAKFRICEAEDMFAPIDEDEKFDFIVANLPFSRFLKTFRSRHSKYYLSFKGTRRILEQLLLGTLSHARANSQLIFCYGESGYMDLLYDLIHLSAWQAQNIVDIDSNGDDRFHIFHLRISDELRSYFGKPPAA
jgi:tRNA1(Val) A37 N6-methylase TrmN6